MYSPRCASIQPCRFSISKSVRRWWWALGGSSRTVAMRRPRSPPNWALLPVANHSRSFGAEMDLFCPSQRSDHTFIVRSQSGVELDVDARADLLKVAVTLLLPVAVGALLDRDDQPVLDVTAGPGRTRRTGLPGGHRRRPLQPVRSRPRSKRHETVEHSSNATASLRHCTRTPSDRTSGASLATLVRHSLKPSGCAGIVAPVNHLPAGRYPADQIRTMRNGPSLGTSRSGWRDLNSRPLDPQIGPLRLSSVNHLSLVSMVDR
jgi:hypothetical protein